MSEKNTNLDKFLYGLFPEIMLKNVLISSIVHIISKKSNNLKNEIDKTLNTDV